ncbi:putative MobA-like protein [Thermanaerovibrio velox DSM 12556]|uniref:Putative MobA-like protein n=1 Tax=Thermanaerovibrio velox DSM 12556 TaxID=926567 RepID=H0UPJ8_9BACT|nr:NTP transferase domain-containing protein [Thermanaerovibrio velox]EHM09545.1 putative MobA-like protein [Thermanaerovibrio velox DSM 12556]
MGMRLGGLVLLGGYSSRMGRFKPGLDIGGATPVERCVRLLSSAGVDPVVAVVGHNRQEAEALVSSAGADVVFNPLYPSGMFSSVRRGVEALMGSGVTGAFVLPVDVPLVRPCTVRALADRFAALAGSGAVDALIPVFRGRTGHPPVIGSHRFEEILGFEGQGGLRALMSGWKLETLDVFDSHVLLDMDTPEDLDVILSRLGRMEAPDREECLEMLRLYNTPPDVVSHSLAVCGAGLSIGRALVPRGAQLDLAMLEAGCLLHDIAKGTGNHEAAGEELLKGLGFERLGTLVGSHRDLPDSVRTPEAEVLFLADKSVKGTGFITLEDRLNVMRLRLRDDPAALAGAERRIGLAMEIRRKVEALAGAKLEEILSLDR